MKILDVRLEEITLENFKNVRYGKISLDMKKSNTQSDIVGVYGQNGSGKTALIEALSLLKILLCGKQMNKKFVEFISKEDKQAVLTFIFCVIDRNTNIETKVKYNVCIGKVEDFQDGNISGIVSDDLNVSYIPAVIRETLSIQIIESGVIKQKMMPYIDTESISVPFTPLSRYKELINQDKSINDNLMLSKKIAMLSSRAFIFSRELINTFRRNYTNSDFMKIYESLIYYGNFRLFIYGTNNAAMLNLDILPLPFNLKTGSSKVNGNIAIPINGNGLIPETAYDLAVKLIDNMNIVLKEIVPNLTISIGKLGEELSENSEKLFKVQLFSNKNSQPIPLSYESEGIKKIFSILQLLINVYNRYSFTVAIDELDSGIFEYLLGELLSIISNKGKGQLIFTSHNLRPLETLDKSCIVFTSTNSFNRYVRPTYIKATNNLRDYYYRDIALGEQTEEVYDMTNNADIAFAFREAGEFCGS